MKISYALLVAASSFLASTGANAQFDLGKLKEMGKQMLQADDPVEKTPQTATSKTEKVSSRKTTPMTAQTAENSSPPKNSLTTKEVQFHDITEKEVFVIKRNKELEAWIKGYSKEAEKLTGEKSVAIKGYAFSNLLKVAQYGDDQNSILLKAPVLGPGISAILLVSQGFYLFKTTLQNVDAKLFLVNVKVNDSLFLAIKEEVDGKLQNILDEDLKSEALGILTECSLEQDFFRQNTYEMMIREGKANVGGIKVISYSTGGAPELGHSILLQSTKSAVTNLISAYAPMKIKLPAKRKSKYCTAIAEINELTKGETLVSCGCLLKEHD